MADDHFKFARTYQVVVVDFRTFHDDVFVSCNDIIIDKIIQESWPATEIITVIDTPENRKKLNDCYSKYIKSIRYIKKAKELGWC
jgi:hypothetical protein